MRAMGGVSSAVKLKAGRSDPPLQTCRETGSCRGLRAQPCPFFPFPSLDLGQQEQFPAHPHARLPSGCCRVTPGSSLPASESLFRGPVQGYNGDFLTEHFGLEAGGAVLKCKCEGLRVCWVLFSLFH